MMRTLLQRVALVLGATLGIVALPSAARAQKALVYCPVSVDATGCSAIVNALTGPSYPFGVDRGYDGTDGTVDLRAVDLFAYSVFVVPSLADGATSQPYAMLRDPEVVEHLKAALIGRIAMWSGTPDQGATNRAMKDALIQNLAGWAGGAFGAAKGPGLVALLDASASATSRYDWVRAITPVPVTSDAALLIYNGVRALDPRATAILTSGAGPVVYDNMATFGFQVPNGAAGVSLDAVGQTGSSQGGQVVLLTMEAGNASGATVLTDTDDYPPGTTVFITGAGWQPGEMVKLTLHHDPMRDADTELTATADGDGKIANSEFAPADYDIDVRFVLTAVGQASGRRAQTTFTDGQPQNVSVSPSSVSVPAGSPAAYTVLVDMGGNASACTITLEVISALPTGVSASFTGGANPFIAGNNDFSRTLNLATTNSGPPAGRTPAGTYSFTVRATRAGNCQTGGTDPTAPGTLVVTGNVNTTVALTSSLNPSTYGQSVTFTATVTGSTNPQCGTVDFKDGAATLSSVTLSGTNVATLNTSTLAAGTHSLTAVYTPAPSGCAFTTNTSPPLSQVVNTRAITITADAKSKIYGAADPALTFAVTTGSLVAGDAFTGSLTRVAGENVGTFAINQGTVALTSNYVLTYVSANLTITPRSLTITAEAKTKAYGDADPALTYLISGGPLVGSDAVTGALTRAAGVNVGTYAILQGTVTAGSNYAILYVGANLTITARALTVTADAAAKVYGNADPTFTYQLTTGTLASGDAFTGALTRVAGENVGSYALQIGTMTAGANYAITFAAANLAISTRPITVTADAQTKTYGNTDPTLTYQVTAGTLAFTDAITGALARAAGENVGAYPITQGTLALTTNYALTFNGASLTINKRAITVTADAKTKVYGDADPALTYQLTLGTLAGSDVISGSLTRASGDNVGTYAILQGSVTAGGNYDLAYVGANLSITPRAIAVAADPQTKVYGNVDPTLTYQVTSGSLVTGDGFTGSLARTTGEAVGTYAITQGSLTAGSNYTLGFTGANLTITTRTITVTADVKTKVYGNVDPTLTYQITAGSLAFSDAFTGSLTRVSGEAVGGYAIQQGTLALNANYALAYIGASLTITARPIAITADAKTKTYGDPDPALTYQLTSGTLVSGDGFTGSLTRALGENVGTYAIQQGSVTAGTNYNLTFNSADLTISPRAITVTADAKSKLYGNADPTLTYQVTVGSLVSGDAFSGALARVAGENVGIYAINQGTLTAGTNYTLTYSGANLTITTRPVTVTADGKTKVYGEVDPALTYQITSGSLVFSDVFSGALTRAAGANVGTYAIQQGTLALSANYDLTFVGANLTITPRPITVTADAKTKTYGDADPPLTYQLTSGTLVEETDLTGTLTRAPGNNVGSYAITQGTVAATANYALTFVGADLTITQRAVTITADAKTKVYGDVDPAFTYQITNGTLVFSDVFSGALARADGENIGTYAIQQGTVTAGTNYSLTFAPADLSITTRPITITADAKSKIYGYADPGLTYQITSGALQFTDAFAGALTRAAGENVGAYAIQQGTLVLSTNYTLTYGGANLVITSRPLTVTADNKSKIAGAVNPPLTGVITGGVAADNITANFNTTAITISPPAQYPITSTLNDPGTKLGNYTVTINNAVLDVLANAKPVLGTISAPLLPTALGTAVVVSVPFTDVDVSASQPYTATIDWGNSTTSVSTFTSPGTISGTKTYSVAGVYIVKVTVKQDNFPITHFDTKTYEYYVVVYDPSGGFVTGGGWINSPAGAYYANPSLTGKANFGFVAKYKKGQSTPDGNTEFQYQAANMNFKATAFDWLVIAGSKAQFKGSGTINGSGDYGFILTGVDGTLKGTGSDTFRMKIWIKATGVIVYDNLMGAPDGADPTTTLGGGSIQIHDK